MEITGSLDMLVISTLIQVGSIVHFISLLEINIYSHISPSRTAGVTPMQ